MLRTACLVAIFLIGPAFAPAHVAMPETSVVQTTPWSDMKEGVTQAADTQAQHRAPFLA